MASLLDGCTPWPEVFVDRYWSSGCWRGCTLDNLLREWARRSGPRTALVDAATGTRLTYANLNRRVDRMAAGFRLRGLRPGQRAVVQLPNVPEFVITVFALMRAGVVPVLCPMDRRGPEVAELVRITEAAGYVAPAAHRGADHMALAAEVAAQGPFLRRVFSYEAPGAEDPYGGLRIDATGCHYFPLGSVEAPPERPLAPDAGQVALLLLAEDREGHPVLVPRTHNDYAYQARAAAEAVSLTEDDVCLVALPAASNLAFGCPGIVGTLSAGGTVVLAASPRPGECFPAVAREGVTLTSLDAEAARLWLDDVRPAPRADLGSLRLVQAGPARSADAPLPPPTVERLAAALGPGGRLQQVVASADGPITLTRLGDPDDTVFGTQGRPLSPDDETRLVDADGGDVPDGESGELLTRGPYTPRGYYRAPDRNARSFTTTGHLRTGTLARRTPDGEMIVTGRIRT
ncbi:AMP-binding protein [Streptomyces beihaiensis]|uniref:AMP-binding protein n=1 Tax=Streptomyces beihaiensis TaxID=2984495 RepID=A0ABT3U7S3_9ACTN|nr:AMP-binding protein [Streptomyces beihaiensis]MCX3064228.1 AMP-binding protein [Streptomyces beihaiensis]